MQGAQEAAVVRPHRRGIFPGALAVLAVSLSCSGFNEAASGPLSRGPDPARQAPRVEDLDLKALLLLQVDRQIFEPFTAERAFNGSVELRRFLALSLGRTGARQAVPMLQALLLDEDSEVRRLAAFGLGVLGDPASRTVLLRVAAGADPATGQEAVAALARLGTPVLDVGEALAALPEEALWERLLPSLYRFEGEASLPLALRALNRPLPPRLRPWAIYALSRRAAPATRDLLRSLVAEQHGWSRAQAARGLGSIAVAADFPYLRPLLDDAEADVVLAVLQSVPGRLSSGAAAAPQEWREPLLRLLEDSRPGVRLAALEAAGQWLLDAELGDALAAVAEGEEEPFASTAVLSLAAGRDPRAVELVARLAASPSAFARRQAVPGAASLGLWKLLRQLADDPEGTVRAKAVRTLLQGAALQGAASGAIDQDSEDLLDKAAEDPDAGVRADLLEYLVEEPRFPLAGVAQLFARTRFDRVVQSRINGVRALVARALAEPAERDRGVKILDSLTSDREYLVRIQVALGLRRLGAQPAALGPADTGRNAESYQGLILRSAVSRRVRLTTQRGAITLELDCPQAPLTCANFLQLVEQGFYQGLTFHRVEPGYLAQGGDPRGDGWGGPGYTLRDELRPAPFERGSLAMARPGRHSAGSQFFISLSRAPDLDGAYTHFGKVVAGDAVLDLLVEGDILVGAEVLD